MSVFLPDRFPKSHAPKQSHRQMTIERRFVPLPRGNKEGRSERLRSLLLTGALRLFQAKSNPGLYSIPESDETISRSMAGGM